MFFYSHYTSTKSLLLLHIVNIQRALGFNFFFLARFWVISLYLDSQVMHHTYNNYLQQDISSLTSTLKTIIKIKNKIKHGCIFCEFFFCCCLDTKHKTALFTIIYLISLQITDLEWFEMICGSVQLSMSGRTVGP